MSSGTGVTFPSVKVLLCACVCVCGFLSARIHRLRVTIVVVYRQSKANTVRDGLR